MGDFLLQKVDSSAIKKAYSFVLKHEAFCVTLSSEFAQNSQFKAVYAIYGKEDICGIITVNASGFLLYCLPDTNIFEQNPELCNTLKELLSVENINTIMGEENGSNILQNLYGRKPVCEWEYFLMEYGGKKLDYNLPPQIVLRKCLPEDDEGLYVLQKQYELVEVLPPGTEHNPARCRLALQKSLKSQLIFALFDNGSAVAKAGTNAVGVNFAQIGGVFTDVKYRNKGFAAFLTNYIAHKLCKNGKRVVLFVKKKNLCAEAAYKKAGFMQFGCFKIVYY